MSTLSATITADTSGFKNAVAKAKKELELFDKSNKSLANTMRKVNDVTDDQVKAFRKSVDNITKATNGTKSFKQSATMLSTEIEKLRQQWDNLSATAKKGEFGKALSNTITQSQTKLKSLQSELTKTKSRLSDIAGKVNLNIGGFNVGGIASQLTKLNPLVLGISTAAKVMYDAFASSETKMDSFRGSMEGLKNTYSEFLKLLNSGDLSRLGDFMTFFRDGRAKYDAQDSADTEKAINQAYNQTIRTMLSDLQEKVASGKTVSDEEIKKVRDAATRANMSRFNVLNNQVIAEGNALRNSLQEDYLIEKLDRMTESAKTAVGKTTNDIFNEADKEIERQKEQLKKKVKMSVGVSGQVTSNYLEQSAIKDTMSKYEKFKDSEKEIVEYLDKIRQRQEEMENYNNLIKTLDKVKNRSDQNREAANREYIASLEEERKKHKELSKVVQESLDAYTKEPKYVDLSKFTNVKTTLTKEEIGERLKNFKGYGEQMKELQAYLDRKKILLENYSLEMDAIGQLGDAYSNLWEIISTGNQTVDNMMQAFGSSMQDAVGLMVKMAEIELAADQAVASGKVTASASGLPFPYNLAAIATSLATVTSVFAKFGKIGKFAEGGIVGGNKPFGDVTLARVNSGEMVLNHKQQGKLFNMINNGGGGTGFSPEVKLRVEGSDLVGAINNYNKKMSKVR